MIGDPRYCLTKKDTQAQEILHAVTERTSTIGLLMYKVEGMLDDGMAHQKTGMMKTQRLYLLTLRLQK